MRWPLTHWWPNSLHACSRRDWKIVQNEIFYILRNVFNLKSALVANYLKCNIYIFIFEVILHVKESGGGFLFVPFSFVFRIFKQTFYGADCKRFYILHIGGYIHIWIYTQQSRSFCTFAFPFACFKCIDPILWPECWNFVCISLKRFIHRHRFLSLLKGWAFNEFKPNCICIIMRLSIRSLYKVLLHIYYTF